jgi:hypothetical protein
MNNLISAIRIFRSLHEFASQLLFGRSGSCEAAPFLQLRLR